MMKWWGVMVLAAGLTACGSGVAQEELDSARQERDQALEQVEEMQAEVEGLQDQVDAESRRAENRGGEVEGLEADVARLEEELGAATSEVSELEATIEAQEAELVQARAEGLGVTEETELDLAGFALYFDDIRIELADAIAGDAREFESVDQINYDPNSNVVSVAATTSFNGVEYSDDGAWTAFRGLALFYDDEGWRQYSPAIAMTVAGSRDGTQTYACSGDFMMRLHDRQAARADWESAC